MSESLAEAHPPVQSARPPVWLMGATGLLAAGVLAMAVAETNLWMHYLIDAGESVSLIGLAFILVAGLVLYKRGRLLASLPLALPWLLFPVITQGDQIIDNLSINWMRLVVHVLLAAIFAMPVAIVVLAARTLAPRLWRGGAVSSAWALIPGLPQLAAGRVRQGTAVLTTLLLALEIWVAVQFLGVLMVITLVGMIWGVLAWASARPDDAPTGRQGRSERLALVLLIGGVALSLGLFVGYKNLPGAYQGSPSYYMDPSQRDAGFRLDRLPVPTASPVAPPEAVAVAVAGALAGHARAFECLLEGYYILDRNYNYDFHNRLFLRSTPLRPEYRQAGIAKTREAMAIREAAQATAATVSLAADDPLQALLTDVRAYAAFTFDRVALLERMSAGFEMTEAGLQHATHLYEGEGKVLGVQLDAILRKHAGVISAAATAPVTAEFAAVSRAVHDRYADRIVGF